jgi:PAS domain S-box-containing protein
MSFDFDALLAGVAWESTPLGDRRTWPRSLEALLALLRKSRRPQYLVWGPDYRFFYNEAFLPVIGIKHPVGFGMPMPDVWPEVWEDIEPLVVGTIRNGVSHYYEDMPFVLQRHGYDELTYFSFSYTPVQDDGGKVRGLMCVLSERTREMLAQANRQAELERLRRLFRQAPGFICITEGASHEYALVNAAFEQLIGQSDIDVLGRKVSEVLPEVEDQGYIALLDSVYSSGESFVGRAMPVRLQRTAGAPETHYVDFVHQPIFGEEGTVWGVFTQGSDVTERVLAEAELRCTGQALQDANARKDQFLAVLGHELRNPLAPIHNATYVLRHLVGDNASAVKCLDIIARQVQQMSTLVEDLVDIARISNGLLTLKREQVDLNLVLLEAVEQVRSKASERDHDVRTTVMPSPANVSGDRVRLTQAMTNLLSNAIRYTPRGGVIEAAVGSCDGDIRVDVSDNGDGIAPELMPNLFEQFAQEKRSVDRGGGLGVGLPLVKALMDAHGGRIEVFSEGRGKGSRFSLYLPADPTVQE